MIRNCDIMWAGRSCDHLDCIRCGGNLCDFSHSIVQLFLLLWFASWSKQNPSIIKGKSSKKKVKGMMKCVAKRTADGHPWLAVILKTSSSPSHLWLSRATLEEEAVVQDMSSKTRQYNKPIESFEQGECKWWNEKPAGRVCITWPRKH